MTYPDRAQLHFNVQSQQQFLDLVYSHTISTEGTYKETFFDTDNHLLMKNNIWMKRVMKNPNTVEYSVKHSRQVRSLVSYTEWTSNNEEMVREYVMLKLKQLKIIGDEEATIEFKHKYEFSVSRYVLTPDDERYTITIDNVHYDNQVYTVCAVRTFCKEADILKLCEPMAAELNTRSSIVWPVLSKVLFYIYQRDRDLFTTLNIKTEKYKLDNLQVFNMDCMYDYDNIVDDNVNYDDIGYFGEPDDDSDVKQQ